MAEAEVKSKKRKVIKEGNFTPDDLRALVNKNFGEGTMKLGSDPSLEIKRLPTGLLVVDEALRGGLAMGRTVEIYGGSSIGKTTFAYMVMAAAQAAGMEAAYVDGEKTFNAPYAAHQGVDIDKLHYHEQVHGPRCIDFMETLIRSKLFGVIVLDSTSSLLPLEELETDMEASSYGMQQAKLMSKAMRKLTAANENGGCIVIFINQLRDNVGVTFGKKTTTSGGRAMSFYASTRLEFSLLETVRGKGTTINPTTGELKSGDKQDVIGHRVQVTIEKDKTGARPKEKTTTFFDYRIGKFDPIEDLIYLGLLYGLIEKKGNSWWVDGYEKKKQTYRKQFKKWLRKHPEVCDELEERLRASFESPTEFAGVEDD